MSAAGSAITFRGLMGEGLGIALWQADGSGPEPAATGHTFVTPLRPVTAHYYVASRDHVDASARGGLAATALAGGWPRLRAALAAARLPLAQLVMRLPLTTAGADKEGEDWFYRDGVETRYLRPQGALPLLLGAIPLIEFAPTRLILIEDYNGARQFSDVRITLASDPSVAARARAIGGSSTDVAEALLADLAGRSVRFVVDAIHLSPEMFGGNGRTHGRYADVPAARMEVLP